MTEKNRQNLQLPKQSKVELAFNSQRLNYKKKKKHKFKLIQQVISKNTENSITRIKSHTLAII